MIKIKQIHFPKQYVHHHPPIRNVNEIFDERRTVGQRAADFVATLVGSWKFILVQSCIFSIWIVLNVAGWIRHWDPYPFILMNLVLSLQAAYTAPIIMMSQNRQIERDRVEAHNDFIINQKAEVEIRSVLEHLAVQNEALNQIQHILISLYGDTQVHTVEEEPEK